MNRDEIAKTMADIRSKVAGDAEQLEAFAAAIRAATKEEDAFIALDPDNRHRITAERIAAAIRASK